MKVRLEAAIGGETVHMQLAIYDCEVAVSRNTEVSAPGRLLMYSMNGEIIPCLTLHTL